MCVLFFADCSLSCSIILSVGAALCGRPERNDQHRNVKNYVIAKP
jgi:hypothetical protein